jgi:cysteine peptidase B
MFKLALVFGSAAAATINGATLEAFEKFRVEFARSYKEGTPEYFKRLEVFAERLEEISELNDKHILVAGYPVFGINKFTDVSKEEFAAMYLNKAIMNSTAEADKLPRSDVKLDGPPANDIDWRTKGVLTPVKDQQQCGSCWAFSATETIESFAQLAGKGLPILAPQQIVSCDKVDGGCNGGWPYQAMAYIKQAGGQETESAYPYTSGGGNTGICKVDKSKFVPGVQVTGSVSVTKGENNLEAALNKGPVSICVDASSWSSYRSGILSTCGTSVDHAVQAVGYTADYWIVRNSWGTSWGESGFIRIARGRDLCLISDYVVYPTF